MASGDDTLAPSGELTIVDCRLTIAQNPKVEVRNSKLKIDNSNHRLVGEFRISSFEFRFW